MAAAGNRCFILIRGAAVLIGSKHRLCSLPARLPGRRWADQANRTIRALGVHQSVILTSRHQLTYVLMMIRTTLTLDDDVAATLDRLRRTRRIGLKQLINEALRRGLKEMGKRRRPGEPVRTEAVALGRLRVASIDNISETLAIVEGESFK